MQAMDIGKCMVGCTAGLGVFVAEEWIGKVLEVQRISDRIILVKPACGYHSVCEYPTEWS